MSLKNNSAEDVESHNRLFDASFYESKLYQFSPDTPAEQSTVAALQLMAATLSLRPNETSQLFVHDIIHKTQQVLLTDQKEGKVRSDTLGKWWESSNSDNVTIGTDDVWVDVAEIAAQASKFDDTLSKLSGAIKVTEAFKVGLKPQEVPAVSNSSFFRKTIPPGRHATNGTHTSSQKPIRSQQVSTVNTTNTTPNPSTTKSQDSARSNGLDWKLLQNTKLISKGIPKVDSHTVVLLDGSPCRPPPASKRTKFSYENSESQEEENSQHTGEHWNKRQHLRNGTSDDSQRHIANQWKNKQSQQSTLQQLNNRQTNQVQFHRNHESSQAQFHRNHEPSQAQFHRNHEASGKFESGNQQQPPSTSAFVTAKQKYTKDQRGKMTGHFQSNQQHGNGNHAGGQNNMNNSNRGRSLGGYGRRRNFRPPARLQDPQDNCPQQPRNNSNVTYGYGKSANNSTRRPPNNNSFNHGNRGFNPAEAAQKILRDQNNSNGAGTGDQDDSDIDPRLKHIDPALVERIESEVLDSGTVVSFDDIAGLEFAKQNIEEAVVWPIRNPELYTGLRVLPKGLLLFGPPGTGKTMIGKAIAHQVSATFFSISASSLTSKWIGEGEKMVRAMFAVAGVRSPSVVFIDEIDSLLTQRTSEENEASRRIKTEFLVQLDGAATSSDEMVLVIGATNRPQELDEAARRRFVKRLYIPLPEADTRRSLLLKLLAKNDHSITDEQLNELVENTKGYSGADVTNLAREASMGPLRELMRKRQSASGVEQPGNSDMRPISSHDFTVALKSIRASVSQKDLSGYVDWNNEFGTQAYMG